MSLDCWLKLAAESDRGGSITCREREGDGGLRLPEQGGLEVPCELAFSGTEHLAKNVRVRTITLAGRLPGCQHVLQGRKGGAGAYTGTPPNR